MRLALDTNPIIYFFEDSPLADIVEPAFEMVSSGQIAAFVSTITITEVLTGAFLSQNSELAETYRRFFYQTENFTVQVLSASTAERAAELRAKYRLKTPDAIVVATAVDSGCDALLTNDKNWRPMSEIEVLRVEDFASQGERN